MSGETVATNQTPTAPQAATRRRKSPTWREARLSAGLTLRALEELTGINRGDVSRLENGRLVPTPDLAADLLRAYGVVR